jgi:lambda family phage tail tape measure protein
VDFASLGIRVESSGVREGATGLDQLTKSATAAETAVEKVTPATKAAGDAAKGLGVAAAGAAAPLQRNTTAIAAAGLSTKQYAQALRLLPAQMTDVVTGLASGQSPFLIAIQQGGQLRDSFGGFGQTLKALGTILTPTRLLIGGLAGAAAIALKTFLDGQKEGVEFAKAIALTGNAAGTTAGQLRQYAQEIDGVIGTEANAAEVLARLASTGKVANQQLESVALAAIKLQKIAGVSLDETIKLFVALGEKPTEAAAKINQQYNFMSISLLRQIRLLEETGHVAEASALAQTRLAETLASRTVEVEESIGSLQKAARATGGFFKEMWDSILDIGREETPEERLAKLEAQLARIPNAAPGARGGGQQRLRLEDQARQLRGQIDFDKLQAQAEAQRLAFVRKMADEEAELFRQRKERQTKAAADAKQLSKAQLSIDLGAIQRALQTETDAYDQQGELLDARRSANLIGERAYYAEKQKLIEQTAAVQIKALEAENARLAQEKLTGVEALQNQEKIKENKAEIIRLNGQVAASELRIGIAIDAVGTKAKNSYDEQIASADAYIAKLAEQYDRELKLQGLGRRERDRESGLGAIGDKFDSQRQGVETELAAAVNDESRQQLQQRLNVLADTQAREEAMYREHFDRLTEMQGDWTLGAKSALNDYFDSARDVATATRDAWSSALDGTTEALLDLVMTGKAGFKDLASSIVRDLLRIQLKAQFANVFGSMGLGGFMKGLGGLFGFGGGTAMAGGPTLPSGIGFAAKGGPIDESKPYIVGEEGPELIVPGRSSFVIPNHKLQSGGASFTFNLHPAPNTDYATFHAMLQQAKQEFRAIVSDDAFRRNGLWARA